MKFREKTLGARLAVRKMKRAGIDFKPVLKEVGLTLNVINNEDQWIPSETEAKLYQLVADKLDDPHLGLHLGEEFDVLDLGAIGYIGLSSETLHDAMLNLQRYLHIVTQSMTLEIDVDDDQATINFEPIEPRHRQYRHVAESICCALMIAYQRFVDRPLQPKEVHFSHVFDGDPAEHERVLNCPVKFGQNRNSLVLNREDLTLHIETADDRLIKALTKDLVQVEQMLAGKASALVARVEHACLPLISKGQAVASVVAEDIGMSERTMQRHLSDQGKSFKSVVDELKKQLALKYLQQEGLNLTQVAFLLGYADQSSFTSAFKRWTGLTPKQAKLSA